MTLATGTPAPDAPLPQTLAEPFFLLGPDGQVRKDADPAHVPEVSDDDCRRLYRGMLQVRLVDERMMKLQRQGRLGFYMQSIGEEATHYGVAYALRPSDWIFPSYREPGVMFWRGYSLTDFTNQLFGNDRDPVKGRQMPVHHSFRAGNIVSISSPVGTQIPQAVGVGMAARIQKKDDVAAVYFGEGTASTGDFHVGCNFAGVFKAPVLFVCRNNGWAISTPLSRQTAAATIAQRGVAYGFPGVRVDGNDLLAMISVASAATARARAGEGPTLIEAVTYRRSAHSSSDDPSVYRDPDEPKPWEQKDPLSRWKQYLHHRGLWDDAWEQQQRDAINEEIGSCLKQAEAQGPPPLSSLIEDVFAEPTAALREQYAEVAAMPRQKSPHGL